MSLAESIKNMRLKALLSQDELADILHVSVGTINRWEKGKVKTKLNGMKTIKAFCSENGLAFDTIEAEWLNAE